jgi:hypothetical protein
MTFNERVVIPLAAVAVLGAGSVGLGVAHADSSTTGPGSLVQAIADKFHLDKAQVQQVFDDHRTQAQANQEQRYADRLTQAVKDGKLTSAQQAALLAEHKQLQAELDAARNQAGPGRHATMDKVRTEATDWAKANNLDAKWLMPGPGRRGHHGMMHHGGSPAPSPSASPQA